MSCFKWEPFMYSSSDTGENFTGMCKELVDYLATHYNFTCVVFSRVFYLIYSINSLDQLD